MRERLTGLLRRGELWHWLALVAAASLIGFAIVLAVANSKQQSELFTELGKGLIQIVVIGVLGTVLKLLADDYQERRQRAEKQAAFRLDIHRRLVGVTNVLRRARTLIEANRSVKTWSEQMLAIMDAGYELRLLRHEIQASRRVPDPPLSDAPRLVNRISAMLDYIAWHQNGFSKNKQRLGELQRAAERDDDATGDERQQALREVWEAISGLDSVADLIADIGPRAIPEGPVSWVKFQADYEMAIQYLTEAALAPQAATAAAAEAAMMPEQR